MKKRTKEEQATIAKIKADRPTAEELKIMRKLEKGRCTILEAMDAITPENRARIVNFMVGIVPEFYDTKVIKNLFPKKIG